jgi:endonuclease YncB( thermonuclease family)
MTRFCLSLALLLLTATPAVADSVEVVDGDTIRVDGQRVRIWDYDAPERPRTCMINGREREIGLEATEGLKSILAGGELRCETKDRDRYGRTVADCWVGQQNIGEAMVRSGWAWALPRYSKGRFLPAQEEAETASRDVWAGHAQCEAPARFRQHHGR